MSDVATAYTQMLTKSPDVPEHVITGILSAGPAAVPSLIELLGDRGLDAAGQPNDGTARPHAAELLGHIGATEAVPALLDTLVADRRNRHLVSACADALAKIGNVIEPALTKLSATRHLHERVMLAMVLASAGERREPITALLAELLPQDPDLLLPLVATYGDPSLAPAVAQVLKGAKGIDARVLQAVHTLRKLGITHTKLNALANAADETIRYEVAQGLLEDIAPEVESLKNG